METMEENNRNIREQREYKTIEIEKCKVCNVSCSKYKCPICIIKFCSVGCFKSHKESDACVKPVIEKAPEEDKNNVVPEYEFETEDTVKPKKLRRLGNDKKIRKCLKNPHLREMIQYMDSTKNPAKDMEQAMQEPIFVEFVEHCLRVVEEEISDSSSDEDSD